MALDLFISSLATALLASTPVLIAASGELFGQLVGVYNLGIEGSMLAGAFVAFLVANSADSLGLGLLAGMATGAAASLLFAAAVVLFRADMVVAGLALTFLSIGVTGAFGSSYVRQAAEHRIPRWEIPLLADIPYAGEALFRHLALVYFAFLFPLAAWFMLYRTRYGLNLRSIGESPSAADVSGISVNAWRLFYVGFAGVFAGLGGAFLSLGTISAWLPQITAGQGWIALAIVLFASWRPLPLILGAFLFGGLGTLGNVAQALGWTVPSQFFSALPYLGTLAVVGMLAWARSRESGRTPWPAALGVHFVRGAD